MSEIDPHMEEKLKTLAENAEEKIEDVISLFKAVRIAIKEKFPYELTEGKINKKTFDAINDHYTSAKFKRAREMFFIPFGVFSESKDQNEELRNEILKEFSEPQNRLKMIEEGKVMVIKVSDKKIDGKEVFYTDVFKAVKNRESLKLTTVNDESVVVDGDLWQPGDSPIPRDYRRKKVYDNKESYDNYQFSKPLDPAWRIKIFGIGFYTGTRDKKIKDPETGEIDIIKAPKDILNNGVICVISWKKDFANQSTPSFILKKPIFFNPCKIKAFDTSQSNDLFIQSTAATDAEIMGGTKLNMSKLVKYISDRVKSQVSTAKNLLDNTDPETVPKNKYDKIKDFYDLGKKFIDVDYIPFIELSDVEKYHMTHKAVKDKDGKIIKDESGWDKTDFNSFALCECSLTGFYTKDGQPPKMIITDSSLQSEQSLFLKFSNGIKSDLPASSVILSLTTSRGNQIYDKDTKQWIVNPDEAKPNAKIKGIKLLINFETLDIDGIKAKLVNSNLKADI